MTNVATLTGKIIANIEKVIVGKRPQIITALAAYFCEGHILLEDVPGVAKTMFARALARSVGCTFKRLQCTPDLLPTDVTGVSVFNQKTGEFEFRPGPVFAQTLLADEINRATPRAQAALLEAMGERRVTADGQTYNLKAPFLVIATQNPIDQEGTFPLPEAQLDRFLVKLSLGYPNLSDEADMLQRLQKSHPIDDLTPVCKADEVLSVQEQIRQVHVDEKIIEYILGITHGSRQHEDVLLGAGPRASIALFRMSQALAAMAGRDFSLPDDVKRTAQAILGHRIILKPESRLRKRTTAQVVKELLDDTPVPVLERVRATQKDYFN